MIETVPLFPRFGELVAHFARRRGGVSAPPYDSLNLSTATGDAPDCVAENRRRLAEALELSAHDWIQPGQVHGARVWIDSEDSARAPAAASADAVLLPRAGRFALSLSADCPLVVIIDPDLGLAGVAHAGWRGTASGVLAALLAAFQAHGACAERLLAAVSPGICGGCYPLGAEVFARLAGMAGLERARSGDRLDLRVLHRSLLVDAGLAPDSVHVHPECSSCSPGDYFSHRRDGARTGRCGAVVGWRD